VIAIRRLAAAITLAIFALATALNAEGSPELGRNVHIPAQLWRVSASLAATTGTAASGSSRGQSSRISATERRASAGRALSTSAPTTPDQNCTISTLPGLSVSWEAADVTFGGVSGLSRADSHRVLPRARGPPSVRA